MKEITERVQKLEDKIKYLKGVSADSLLFENYYSVVSATIDLMKHSTEIETLPGLESLSIKAKSAKYFDVAQTAADLAIDINRRNYSSAIVNAVYIYENIFNKQTTEDFIDKQNAGKSTGSGDIKKKKKEEVEKRNKTKNALFKYGSFIALVAQAKSSDEVEAAIETFALPTGSARIKRVSKFNVALNAYCGLFVGKEKMLDSDKDWTFKDRDFNSWGVSAPIGISFSLGNIRRKNMNGLILFLFLLLILVPWQHLDLRMIVLRVCQKLN